MTKTITFVTNQYSCDRIIQAAAKVAAETCSELVIVGVLDSEYELNAHAVDYLFTLSKDNKATMRLLFSDNKVELMREITGQYDNRYIVTGMPQSNDSVLYSLWKEYPDKSFYTVDTTGELIEVEGAVRVGII